MPKFHFEHFGSCSPAGFHIICIFLQVIVSSWGCRPQHPAMHVTPSTGSGGNISAIRSEQSHRLGVFRPSAYSDWKCVQRHHCTLLDQRYITTSRSQSKLEPSREGFFLAYLNIFSDRAVLATSWVQVLIKSYLIREVFPKV